MEEGAYAVKVLLGNLAHRLLQLDFQADRFQMLLYIMVIVCPAAI